MKQRYKVSTGTIIQLVLTLLQAPQDLPCYLTFDNRHHRARLHRLKCCQIASGSARSQKNCCGTGRTSSHLISALVIWPSEKKKKSFGENSGARCTNSLTGHKEWLENAT